MTGTIFLENAELSVSETDGQVVIPILRTGDLSGTVNIEYGITEDGATDGADYIGTSGTITMGPDVDRVAVPVTILDDNASEPTESFVLSLINVDSGFLQAPRTARVDILDDENPVTDPPEPPLVSDFNVTEVDVVTGLTQPIDMVFDPLNPSRAYVAEKAGIIKVVDLDTGGTISQFVNISSQVNNRQDRGLLDIELHPDFANNPYVYAFYVVDPPGTQGQSGNDGSNGGGNRFAWVTRFEADASNGYLTAVPGSEEIILGAAGQTLSDISGNGDVDSTSDRNQAESGVDSNGEYIDDYIKLDSRSHAGGALAFGPDGNLYVSIGDGTSFNYADTRTKSVQELDSLSGKILRVDPETGLGLADNPFVEGPNPDLSANRSKVYQLGLRNPFSMGFDDDGQLFITDTGWNSYEEINSGAAGANFGWPWFEGGDNGVNLRTGGYRDFPEAAAFYAAVAAGTIDVTAAYRAFSHRSSDPGFQGQSITGGNVVYQGDKYPSEFLDDYFFVDFSQAEVFTVDVNDRREVKFLYETPANRAPVHYTEGDDGYVYYVDLVRGEIGRLEISGTEIFTNGADNINLNTVDLSQVTPDQGSDALGGNDTVTLSETQNIGLTFQGGQGNDVITGSSNDDVIEGNGGSDTLFGLAGDDTLDGGADSDQLIGGPGADTLIGGTGNDFFYGVETADTVLEAFGSGNWDTIFAVQDWTMLDDQEIEAIRASAGTTGLALTGNNLTNYIFGGDGNDTLSGGGAYDFIEGGNGNDTINGDDGSDALYGEAGDDTINGGGNTDDIYGGLGNDNLSGDAGDDFFYGVETGDSVFEAIGGGSWDTVYAIENWTMLDDQEIEAIRADAGNGGLTLTGNNLTNYIYGGDGDDTLNGAGDYDFITGGNGNDTINGGNDTGDLLFGDAGDDTINGGDGNDDIYGGIGADIMNGGADSDFYYGVETADSILEAADPGSWDTVYAVEDWSATAGQEIEAIRVADGFSGGLSLTGNELTNYLYGGDGNDTLNGGGSAFDVLTGGAGGDLFVMEDDSGVDRIEDFEKGADQIDMSRLTGLTSFSQLAISQNGPNTLIEFGDVDVYVANPTGFVFDAGDIIV